MSSFDLLLRLQYITSRMTLNSVSHHSLRLIHPKMLEHPPNIGAHGHCQTLHSWKREPLKNTG